MSDLPGAIRALPGGDGQGSPTSLVAAPIEGIEVGQGRGPDGGDAVILTVYIRGCVIAGMMPAASATKVADAIRGAGAGLHLA